MGSNNSIFENNNAIQENFRDNFMEVGGDSKRGLWEDSAGGPIVDYDILTGGSTYFKEDDFGTMKYNNDENEQAVSRKGAFYDERYAAGGPIFLQNGTYCLARFLKNRPDIVKHCVLKFQMEEEDINIFEPVVQRECWNMWKATHSKEDPRHSDMGGARWLCFSALERAPSNTPITTEHLAVGMSESNVSYWIVPEKISEKIVYYQFDNIAFSPPSYATEHRFHIMHAVVTNDNGQAVDVLRINRIDDFSSGWDYNLVIIAKAPYEIDMKFEKIKYSERKYNPHKQDFTTSGLVCKPWHIEPNKSIHGEFHLPKDNNWQNSASILDPDANTGVNHNYCRRIWTGSEYKGQHKTNGAYVCNVVGESDNSTGGNFAECNVGTPESNQLWSSREYARKSYQNYIQTSMGQAWMQMYDYYSRLKRSPEGGKTTPSYYLPGASYIKKPWLNEIVDMQYLEFDSEGEKCFQWTALKGHDGFHEEDEDFLDDPATVSSRPNKWKANRYPIPGNNTIGGQLTGWLDAGTVEDSLNGKLMMKGGTYHNYCRNPTGRPIQGGDISIMNEVQGTSGKMRGYHCYNGETSIKKPIYNGCDPMSKETQAAVYQKNEDDKAKFDMEEEEKNVVWNTEHERLYAVIQERNEIRQRRMAEFGELQQSVDEMESNRQSQLQSVLDNEENRHKQPKAYESLPYYNQGKLVNIDGRFFAGEKDANGQLARYEEVYGPPNSGIDNISGGPLDTVFIRNNVETSVLEGAECTNSYECQQNTSVSLTNNAGESEFLTCDDLENELKICEDYLYDNKPEQFEKECGNKYFVNKRKHIQECNKKCLNVNHVSNTYKCTSEYNCLTNTDGTCKEKIPNVIEYTTEDGADPLGAIDAETSCNNYCNMQPECDNLDNMCYSEVVEDVNGSKECVCQFQKYDEDGEGLVNYDDTAFKNWDAYINGEKIIIDGHYGTGDRRRYEIPDMQESGTQSKSDIREIPFHKDHYNCSEYVDENTQVLHDYLTGKSYDVTGKSAQEICSNRDMKSEIQSHWDQTGNSWKLLGRKLEFMEEECNTMCYQQPECLYLGNNCEAKFYKYLPDTDGSISNSRERFCQCTFWKDTEANEEDISRDRRFGYEYSGEKVNISGQYNYGEVGRYFV